jgi:steroid delta-isomerase-like uncharacterized protein
MATAAKNTTEVVQQTIDAINDKDQDRFVEVLAPDIVHHQGSEVLHGVDAIIDQKWSFLDAFPDYTITPEIVLAEGDMVAMRWTATGTHHGEFNGIEPTGEEFTVSDMGMYRVEKGKITEVWIAADVLGLLVQLGVVELPE